MKFGETIGIISTAISLVLCGIVILIYCCLVAIYRIGYEIYEKIF